MSANVERLLKIWDEAGVRRPAASDSLVREFERKFDSPLPPRLSHLYRLSDGAEMDANCFSFWPLSRVLEWNSSGTSRLAVADWLAETYSYFADISTPGCPISFEDGTALAASFDEFCGLLTENADRLYLERYS